MIFNLFRKPAVAPDAVDETYRSIVAQSRQERFYADWGVADTVTGRFDMTDARKLALKLGAALDLKVEFGANGPILGAKSE